MPKWYSQGHGTRGGEKLCHKIISLIIIRQIEQAIQSISSTFSHAPQAIGCLLAQGNKPSVVVAPPNRKLLREQSKELKDIVSV